MPPNHRHWSRMCSWSSADVRRGGDADRDRRRVAARGGCGVAVRAAIIHSVMSTSASCRMKPSPTSPADASAPLARTRRPTPRAGGAVPPREPAGRCPCTSTSSAVRQLADDVDRLAQTSSSVDRSLAVVTRTAESPRPMPQTVRLPNISLSVAKSDAVTVQSRVAGFVTIGPTITRLGLGEDLAVDDVRLLPEQVRVERPDVREAERARPASRARRPARGRIGLQHDPDVHRRPSWRRPRSSVTSRTTGRASRYWPWPVAARGTGRRR